MIFYHGTPIGGTTVDAAMFLTSRHGLVSYANQGHMEQVAGCCSSFVLDNGAFTFWQQAQKAKEQGKPAPPPIDWDEYYRWVNEWAKHPGYDWHLIPDIIDGTEDDNWRLMFHYGRKAPYGVPVYHLHESLEHLERLVKNYPRIALGSSGEWKTPGTKAWKSRMAEIMAVVCDPDGVPQCKLHGLRMMNKKIFTLYPFSSVDSCNAGRNNGRVDDRWQDGYMPEKAWQRATVIAWNVEGANSPARWIQPEEPAQQEFALCACSNS